jgi:hypothetical protein
LVVWGLGMKGRVCWSGSAGAVDVGLVTTWKLWL